jgi:hypothetical protein
MLLEEPYVPGFPESNIQIIEVYNSAAQTRARTHPALLQTQRAILQLWHSSDPEACLSLRTPVSYFDRLRIRQPGDSSFALAPHIDGGSLERWEDPGYRACFEAILSGRWREHDPFDAALRLHACQDLYQAPCAPFLPTSLPGFGYTYRPQKSVLDFPPLARLDLHVDNRPW